MLNFCYFGGEIIFARLKNTFLYLMNIECARGCSVADWLSRIIKPQPFSHRKIFNTLSRLKIPQLK